MIRFINWHGPDGAETLDSLDSDDFDTKAAFENELQRLVQEYSLAGMRGAYVSRCEIIR